MDPVTQRLRDATLSGSADLIDAALAALWQAGECEEHVPHLNALLEQTTHMVHEDIARALQRLRHPSSVPVLFATATRHFAYRDYDDARALARKCIWALADIGTDEARDKLRILATDQDELVAGFARKRLSQWEAESGRKRDQESR